MKKLLFVSFLNLVLIFSAVAQDKAYVSSAGEMIFSFADIDDNGNSDGSIIRWAPVFNLQGMLNKDFGKNFGIFAGLAVRNVGYIYDNYTIVEEGEPIEVKKKFRTYNVGLPVGIKLGNLEKFFIYGGYEVELPFHYKEKTFRDEKKDKFTVWFSDRVETFQHGFLVGLQLPGGANVKFKYYLSNFHNKDFTESTGNKPYDGLNANVFYFSLNYNLFKPAKSYYNRETGKSDYF